VTPLQADYFNIESHRFSTRYIAGPLYSQLLEMYHLKRSLKLPRGSHLVDFGCGSGRLSMYFLSHGYSVLAVDISAESLTELTKIYKQLHQNNWGRLTVATGLPHKTYDGIIGSDILHHVNLEKILPQLYQVLKPGGKMAFSEPNALNIFWYIYYLIYHIPWNIEQGILQNTYFNIYRLFKNNLFKNIRICGHGLFPTRIFNFSSPLCRFNCLNLGNILLFKPVAYRLIITAEK
jgi:2-polyprenyl-3-methyl-5-hydroxy-6-metoxy-1,4-benzoquinol methylase